MLYAFFWVIPRRLKFIFTFGRLSRMLANHNIKSVALPPRKISTYFPPVKDASGDLQHPM
jgi:hypothetical protein